MRQEILLDLPQTSNALGTASEQLAWLHEYSDIDIVIEYQAYDVGDLTMYAETSVDNFATADTLFAFPIQGAGLLRVCLPWPAGFQAAKAVIGDVTTPAFSGTGGVPMGPTIDRPVRFRAQSGAGITPGDAYIWLYITGLRKK